MKRVFYLMTVCALFLMAFSPTQAAQEAEMKMTSPTVDEAEPELRLNLYHHQALYFSWVGDHEWSAQWRQEWIDGSIFRLVNRGLRDHRVNLVLDQREVAGQRAYDVWWSAQWVREPAG